jgi:hypothetical protein
MLLMERVGGQPTSKREFVVLLVAIAVGITLLPSPLTDIPYGILAVSILIGGVVQDSLKGNWTAFWATSSVLVTVVLWGVAAEIAARRWLMALLFLGIGTLLCLAWRREYLRRRNAPQVAP